MRRLKVRPKGGRDGHWDACAWGVPHGARGRLFFFCRGLRVGPTRRDSLASFWSSRCAVFCLCISMTFKNAGNSARWRSRLSLVRAPVRVLGGSWTYRSPHCHPSPQVQPCQRSPRPTGPAPLLWVHAHESSLVEREQALLTRADTLCASPTPQSSCFSRCCGRQRAPRTCKRLSQFMSADRATAVEIELGKRLPTHADVPF